MTTEFKDYLVQGLKNETPNNRIAFLRILKGSNIERIKEIVLQYITLKLLAFHPTVGNGVVINKAKDPDEFIEALKPEFAEEFASAVRTRR